MQNQLFDEGPATSTEVAISKRPKPQFLTIGEGRAARKLCSTGRFHSALGAEYLLEHRTQWTSVGELSRVFYGANTPTGKAKIRHRMFELFNYLIQSTPPYVLLYEFDGTRISAVKVYDAASAQDRQAASERIEKMAKRCKWTQQQFDLVINSLKNDDLLADEAGVAIEQPDALSST